ATGSKGGLRPPATRGQVGPPRRCYEDDHQSEGGIKARATFPAGGQYRQSAVTKRHRRLRSPFDASVKLDQVPPGFFAVAFGAFAGAGGGPGARSIDTRRPPVKR